MGKPHIGPTQGESLTSSTDTAVNSYQSVTQMYVCVSGESVRSSRRQYRSIMFYLYRALEIMGHVFPLWAALEELPAV